MHVLQALENVADNIDSEALKKGLLQTHNPAPKAPAPEVNLQTPPGVTSLTPEAPVQTPVDVGSTESSPGWNDEIYDSPLELPVQTPVVAEVHSELSVEVQAEIPEQVNRKRSWTETEGEVEKREGERSTKKLKT